MDCTYILSYNLNVISIFTLKFDINKTSLLEQKN